MLNGINKATEISPISYGECRGFAASNSPPPGSKMRVRIYEYRNRNEKFIIKIRNHWIAKCDQDPRDDERGGKKIEWVAKMHIMPIRNRVGLFESLNSVLFKCIYAYIFTQYVPSISLAFKTEVWN